ncbi:MAG: M20/M25/M40 family metallo-hydrolase [Clostridiales bacterium]|nr:M20/M25/M40 family metallo-hydrolase [Clostridiales bacterium]
MNELHYALIGLGALILIFVLVILIRTFTFKPKDKVNILTDDEPFDKEASVNSLKEMVKCKTVSYYDSELEDPREFEKFVNLLPNLFPNVHKVCTLTKMPGRGLLYLWKGKETGPASVMMSHYDVVPANEEFWEKPAFDGIIEEGVLWGRGTLDTKATLNGVLSSAEELIKRGFTPNNDVYFAFSGTEEINGKDAPTIVDYFEQNNIEIGLVIDEGGAVVEGVFPGVSKPCGLIGIAEKGFLNVEYKIKSQGGHASAPKPNSPIVSLSKAVLKVEENPFKYHLTKPVNEMFDTLGRHSNFLYRMIFANLWLFKGVLNGIAKKSGGEMNALLRTTVAFTQATGSDAPNVIPPEAKVVSNIRINPLDTIDTVIAGLKERIDNDKIEITDFLGVNPSRISETNCEEFKKVERAVASTWKGTLVSPYLMVQCSDSRHYGRVSDKVYRFSAMALTTEERASIHGNNERIKIENIHKAVEFYIRVLKQC